MKIKNIPKILEEITLAMLESKNDLPPELKLQLAELIVRIVARRKEKFGLFVILGWQNKWRSHTDLSDRSQDIFARGRTNIMDLHPVRNGKRAKIVATINFDGAILVDGKGNITHSGIIIEGLRPKIIAQKVNPGSFADLSAQFGFKEKVHTRHLAAITASYIFKNTTVFTVSEESGTFHIFEGGRIIYAHPS